MSSAEGISGVGENIGAFSPAYAAFAINVDSREAEARPVSASRRASPGPSAYPGYSGGSILKHGKSRSQNVAEYPAQYRAVKDSRSPPMSSSAEFRGKSSGRQGVRFDAKSEQQWREKIGSGGHRRSSTAAFIEYLKQNMPLNPQQTHVSFRITPKRAFLLFCIVFSASYLSMALLSLVAGPSDYSSIPAARRTAGYYGNSRIFRGGDNLGDPHAAGDEHHNYIARAAVARGSETRRRAYQAAAQPVAIHLPEEAEPHDDHGAVAARRLQSATMAEQARIQQLQAEQRRARANLKEVALPSFERFVRAERDGGAESGNGTAAIRPKRPIMPFDKLAKERNAVSGAAASVGDQQQGPAPEAAHEPNNEASDGQAAGETGRRLFASAPEEFEMTDSEQVAELRKKAAARRLAKKLATANQAKAAGAPAVEEAVVKKDRPALKLSLVARKRKAQFEAAEDPARGPAAANEPEERELEEALILSEPM